MKFLVSFIAYNSHYPNPDVFPDTATVSRPSMDGVRDRDEVQKQLSHDRGYARVVIGSWEEVKND
jgi:hypothetical protein